jgi:hypothetical protein
MTTIGIIADDVAGDVKFARVSAKMIVVARQASRNR